MRCRGITSFRKQETQLEKEEEFNLLLSQG
jgi:hypothetical protein